MNLCTHCKNIDFKNLPSEDRPAVPHQPSLAALKSSADTCRLCQLLLKVIGIIRDDIRGESNGQKPKTAGYVAYVPNRGAVYEGRVAPGSYATALGSSKQQDASVHRQITFSPDTDVQPWLFGNWWRHSEAGGKSDYSDVDECDLRIIGLGVRLSQAPEVAHGTGKGRIYRGTYLRIRTDDKTDIASIVPGRLCMADYTSDLSLQRIQRWVLASDLDRNQSMQSPRLPSRVIDVDPDTSAFDVRLVETNGKWARYIALSHRWGGSETLTTTSSTLASRISGIRWNELPKTFQDAIQITRLLHVRYLWIDSLCIVQDDKEDWKRESSKMADVYMQSYLTIAASSSTNSSSGCLPRWQDVSKSTGPSPDERTLGVRISQTNRPRLAHDPQERGGIIWYAAGPFVHMDTVFRRKVSRIYVTLEWMPSSFKEHASLYSIPSYGRPIDPLDRSELSKRGWVLQERLLSPRTIHFSRDQMYLETEKSIIAEDGSTIQNQWFNLGLLLHRERQSWSEHGIPKGKDMSVIEGYPLANHHSHGRWHGGWLQHIENYTMRQLTVPEDKLPALSGVARVIAMNTDDTYYAGLWKSHLPEDLAWRTYSRIETRVNEEDGFCHEVSGDYYPTTVPAQYRAPSWSWASLDARIRFIPLDYGNLVAEILDCQVNESVPFGAVSGGQIKIWAPLVEIFRCPPGIKFDKGDPIGFGTFVQFHLDAGIVRDGRHYDGISYGEAFFDIAPTFPCWALFLDASNALLLHPYQQKYERVGFGKFLRTKKQRLLEPLRYSDSGPLIDGDENKPEHAGKAFFRRDHIPYGPIGRGYPCRSVIIV